MTIKEQILRVLDEQIHNPHMTFDDFKNKIEEIMKKHGFRDETPNDKEHILICQLNGIGDAILVSGFLRELRKNYSSATISIVCHDRLKQIFEYCPYVDNIFPLEQAIVDNILSRIITIVNFFEKIKLWDMKPTMAFSTHCSELVAEAILLSWLSGAQRRIGYGETSWKRYFDYNANFVGHEDEIPMDSLLTDNVQHPLEIMNDVDRRYYLLEYLGKQVTDKKLELWTSPEDKEKAKSIFEPYQGKKKILIGVGGSMGNKQYPLHLYRKAIEEIKKLDDNTVFFSVGSEGEDNGLFDGLDENTAISLCGKLSLREVEAITEQANMYIGNDTCTVHMAAAAGIPIILLCREAKDRTPVYTGFMSAYTRFFPYSTGKVISIQPEKAIDECTKAIIHGGCCHYEAHCITTIPYEKIVEAYKKIFELK